MKKSKICPETQIWEENGKIMKEDIVREANGEVDLTPHPTRARVLMVDGEVRSIHSKQGIQHGYKTPKLPAAICACIVEKILKY